jgi:general secretion pathway protein L
MTDQNILNTDVSVIWRLLCDGLRWWVNELADMTPPALRRSLGGRAPWVAEAQSLSGPVRMIRRGEVIETLNLESAAAERGRLVELRAPAAAALVQELDLPPLSAADRRRLLELNMDRYTPFTAAQVYFDAAVVGVSENEGRQRVRLAVLEKSRARAVLDLAESLGLAVKRLGVAAAADGGEAPPFDFMPAVRRDRGEAARLSLRGWLWAGCAALALANVVVAVVSDMRDVARLQEMVDAQRPMVERVARVRAAVEGERRRRLDLLTRRSTQEPLRILDAVSRALPSQAWVERFEWNGRNLRLAGFRPPELDLAGALRGPVLSNVRSLASDMPTKTASGQASFDVIADTAGKPRR